MKNLMQKLLLFFCREICVKKFKQLSYDENYYHEFFQNLWTNYVPKKVKNENWKIRPYSYNMAAIGLKIC